MGDPKGKLVTPVGFDSNGDPRALSLLWGFKERIAQYLRNNSHGAGDIIISLPAVPAGEVWTVVAIWGMSTVAARNMFVILQCANSTTQYLDYGVSGGAWVPRVTLTSVVMSEGDYIQVKFFGTNLNEDLRCGCIGSSMGV